MRLEHDREPDHNHHHLDHEVGDGDEDPAAQAARRDTEEIVCRDEADHRQGDRDLEPSPPQRRPERGQVAGDGKRRDRDQDRVVEHDRPCRDEAHRLIQAVAGEDRGAASFLVQRCPLAVGHRREPEEDARDQEHCRGEPGRVMCDHPEREVDGADRGRVDDGEQRAVADRPIVQGDRDWM